MTSVEIGIMHVVKLGFLACLAGIFARRRQGVCWAFVAYIVVVLLGNSLISFWPDRFYNPSFWILKEGAYTLARVAVAIELAYYAFRFFPGARATARALLLSVLGLTIVLSADSVGAALSAGSYKASYPVVLVRCVPAVLTGTMWLMAVTAILVIWYHLPVDAFHRVILLGFVTYLLIWTNLLNLLRHRGLGLLKIANRVDALAYLGVLVWWTIGAWRTSERTAVSEDLPAWLRLENV